MGEGVSRSLSVSLRLKVMNTMGLFEIKPSSIFRDARWLQPLSDPPGGRPLCRDEDLKIMADLISGVFRVGRGRNLFVCGRPGTGKTLCIKYIINEVRRSAKALAAPIWAVYVNAGWTRTPYYTMREILTGLGLKVPEAGWQMFRLKNAFEKIVESKAVVIAIDEVDILLHKEREPLVYYLNRQPNTTLIFTSNRFEEVADLPERIISTLQPKIIILKPYTKDEAFTILRERAKHALKPGSYNDEILKLAAQTAEIIGDIRMGFTVLLTAGLNAEKSGKTSISIEDVVSAIESEAEKELLRRKLANLLKKQRRPSVENLNF